MGLVLSKVSQLLSYINSCEITRLQGTITTYICNQSQSTTAYFSLSHVVTSQQSAITTVLSFQSTQLIAVDFWGKASPKLCFLLRVVGPYLFAQNFASSMASSVAAQYTLALCFSAERAGKKVEHRLRHSFATTTYPPPNTSHILSLQILLLGTIDLFQIPPTCSTKVLSSHNSIRLRR